jgi:hypothetical protein
MNIIGILRGSKLRSTPLKGILIFLIALFIGGYLFYAEIPPVYGQWKNPSVSTTPPSITTNRGSTVTCYVQVLGASTPYDPVSLTVFYSYYTTGEHYPPDLTITLSENNKQAPFTTTMTVQVSSSARYGTYLIQLLGKTPSSLDEERGNAVELEVMKPKLTIAPTLTFPTPTTSPGPTLTPGPTAAPFDFTLLLSPPSVTVEQGEITNYQLQLIYSDPSYSGTQINYQVTGLGPGITWIPAGGGAITISTSPTTPPGTYPITVIGSAQGVSRQASSTLIVTEPPPSEGETTTTSVETTSTTPFSFLFFQG